MNDEEGASTSASGERSRRWRERMSEEEKERFKKSDKELKKMKWDTMTEEKRKKMRENIAKKRAEKKKKEKEEKEKERKQDLYVDNDREHNREYKRWKAAERSEEEAEFDRIEQMLRRKKSRASCTEEEHMIDKENARKGMQDHKELGFLKQFKERDTCMPQRLKRQSGGSSSTLASNTDR